MREVILGKYAGFCPGVKKAWKMVESAVEEKGEVYVLGELIHNQQAIEEIKKWGVVTVESVEDLENKSGKVIIRAHGEPPTTYRELRKTSLKIVDATCPNVLRVQKLARDLEEEGYLVVICGEKGHAEAVATIGNTKNGIIVETVEEAKTIKKSQKIGIVSQTTFNEELLEEIIRVLKKTAIEVKIVGTICNFTQLARKEAAEIAQKADVVVVVGGRHSSNTKRLVETAAKFKTTFHVETPEELEESWFKNVGNVGLLAGASTPEWIINKVEQVIKNYE